MTIEIGLLFAAIACIIGVITFVAGRQTSAKGDGVWKGTLDTNIGHIQDDLKEIKATMSASKATTDEMFEHTRKDFKESISNVHDRLDDHLRTEHDMKVPQRKKNN